MAGIRRTRGLAIVLRTHLNLPPHLCVRIRLLDNVVDTRVNTWPVLTKNTEFQTRLYYNIPVVLYRFRSSFLVRSCVMVSGVEQDVDRNESNRVFLFSVACKKGRGLTSRGWYYIIFYCTEVPKLWITGTL